MSPVKGIWAAMASLCPATSSVLGCAFSTRRDPALLVQTVGGRSQCQLDFGRGRSDAAGFSQKKAAKGLGLVPCLRWPCGRANSCSSGEGNGQPRRHRGRAHAGRGIEFDIQGDAIFDNYYSVLSLSPDATPEEIKRAYYSCMKTCHPDLTGNHPENVAFCQFVNEIYEVLSDEDMRAVYDEINGYTSTAVNPFLDNRFPPDYVFVDEYSCIGCKNCANTAESTFTIEPDFGRARVCDQRGNPDGLIVEAIDTCPVNCIHRVTAPQLSLLEDEMRRMERVSVGSMLAGMGGAKGGDVFGQARVRWEKRQAAVLEATRLRMAREHGKKATSQWGGFWAPASSEAPPEEEKGKGSANTARQAGRMYNAEKMGKAAAAARRWREYSRSGVDRRPKRVLPAAAGKDSSEAGVAR